MHAELAARSKTFWSWENNDAQCPFVCFFVHVCRVGNKEHISEAMCMYKQFLKSFIHVCVHAGLASRSAMMMRLLCTLCTALPVHLKSQTE